MLNSLLICFCFFSEIFAKVNQAGHNLIFYCFVQVQGTNDSSVVSKVSAAAQGYYQDDFLQHFVSKVHRRTPLINRWKTIPQYAQASVIEVMLTHHVTRQ